MKPEPIKHIHIQTLAQHNATLGFGKPRHPLFSIQRFEDFPKIVAEEKIKLSMDFYQLTFKKGCTGKFRYGQSDYDFDEGVLSFFSPRQVFITEGNFLAPSGFIILVHPDYLKGYALESKIKSFGFFDYTVSEALILSEEEETFIENVFVQVEKEFMRPIDALSQDVIISNLELLLTYSNRFYTRQFITRKPQYSDLLSKFELVLNDLFKDEHIAEKGVPTVTGIAAEFNLSPKYFSDLLKQHTGQSTQHHIHNKLIEKAKEKLALNTLSVSEIAYQLGFEHSQSFSKLFKSKTKQSPLEYRNSFN